LVGGKVILRGTKHNFESVKKEFEKRGYELLETSYISNSTKMKYICSIHKDKVLTITYHTLLRGSGCKLCGAERSNEANRQYNYDDAIKEFAKLGYTLLDNKYVNVATPLEYICSKHPGRVNKTSLNKILSGTRCKWCRTESRRRENSSNWKGGITGIRTLLRDRISNWIKESLEKNNYKCDITGINSDDLEVHHIKPFHIMRDEVITELGLKEIEYVSDFSIDEIQKIVALFEKKHQENLGIPLLKDLHKIFHKLYGFNTTFDDYTEFKNRYHKGEFHVKSIEEWKKKTTNLAQLKKKKPEVILKGRKISFAEASRITGISINALHERYKRGDRGERLFRKVEMLVGKLSDKQIIEIREMLKSGDKQSLIAKKFGVSVPTISNIKRESLKKYKQNKA
jgi:DNA-binding CsgD family transcriptional regulator